MLDVVIIGSGPYGISLAAHAVFHKLKYKLLGYPMDFWKNKMPQDMFIRTPHDFCSFSDAKDELTIERFSKETGTKIFTPLPRPIFEEYAMWFAKKAEVEFTPELVTSLTLKDDVYTVITEAGHSLQAKNVVIATGVEHYKYIPELFRSLPSHLVSHTSGYTSFQHFSDKKVAIVGSGQSAWEAAALLHREGSEVELIYRRKSAKYGGSRFAERYIQKLGYVFYKLPTVIKKKHWGQSEGSVAHFLRPYVEGKVHATGSVRIVKAQLTSDNMVSLLLSDGSSLTVDHIISATGFRINVDRVPFFSKEMLKMIDRETEFTSFPKLNKAFESNMSGLFFAGPLSSHSHGPTFRFILGLRKSSKTIISAIAIKSGHPKLSANL